MQSVFMFRGDLALRAGGDFQKAADAYGSCLGWISDNNLSIRRDVLEGMARCFTKLGRRNRALDIVNLLKKEMTNTCHLTSLLLLKVTIYGHFECTGAELSCLQQLCSLLPFNPWHWHSLGQTCLQLLERQRTAGLCSSQWGETAEGDEEEDAAEFSEDRIWLKACTSLIRTRLLLRILQQQQSSFVRRRSENTLRSTEEALRRLNPQDWSLRAVTQVMSEDLIPEKMREDNQDGESLSNICVQSFRDRWWNKILSTGVLETDGPSALSTAGD
ncbi:unnamed protein product [Tetraodon nigroviridis]|uniref:(spotted green pufferfish) hypothetical protein n=1 Tax=Tetraodon nigroviridis TaxID=99883 RepID=Q4RFH2_TETNG|nr:unnamed protein product [Tetraodon nigroviridis]